MEDKMVELTRFFSSAKAEVLANLLKSEGIDCYVRDNFIHQIYGEAVDFGGIRIELLEKDLQRAQEIMDAFGYNKNDDDQNEEQDESTEPEITAEEQNEQEEQDEQYDSTEPEITAEEVQKIVQQNKAKLKRTMYIYIILILLLLACIIFLNHHFHS